MLLTFISALVIAKTINFGSFGQGRLLRIITSRNTAPEGIRLPTYSVDPLTSNLFKDDSAAQKIIAANPRSILPGFLDLSHPEIYQKSQSDYMETLAYKVLVALHEIGYQYEGTSNNKDPDFLVKIFNRFQIDNNLPVSPALNKASLSMLDSSVTVKENEIKGYSEKMGTVVQKTHPNSLKNHYSKDFIAWIFMYPIEILPKNLTQNFSPENYMFCLSSQCVGSISDFSDSKIIEDSFYLYKSGEYYFLPDVYINDPDKFYFDHKSTSNVGTILHEFAHYLDGRAHPSFPERNEGIIDTLSFFQISFMADEKNTTLTSSPCVKREGNDISDFISHYPYTGYPSLDCANSKGPEYGAPKEDFAESFVAYVMAGKIFRNAADTNGILKQKYDWLKINVFNGVQYDTAIAYGEDYNISGCKDAINTDLKGGPFYLSCDSNYKWDGKIKKLQE